MPKRAGLAKSQMRPSIWTEDHSTMPKLRDLELGGGMTPKFLGKPEVFGRERATNSVTPTSRSLRGTSRSRNPTTKRSDTQHQATQPETPAQVDMKLFGVQGINHLIKRRQSLRSKSPQRRNHKNITVQLAPRQ